MFQLEAADRLWLAGRVVGEVEWTEFMPGSEAMEESMRSLQPTGTTSSRRFSITWRRISIGLLVVGRSFSAR